MLLSLLLVGLAIGQRSEWMDEFDPEKAYLSFISISQKKTESNATEIQLMDSDDTTDGEETDAPPPPLPPMPERRGPRPGPPPPPGPPGPRDRCGDWNNWQQAKCWWPDQSLDKLPPACTAIPTKPDWPSWMKKFVASKAMEKYSMLMEEFKTRGSPPKCGFCARSFECRTRNSTYGGDFCPMKQIRPMFGVDCEDKMACEVTQEKGGCPPPLFLGGGRRERLQQMIKEDNHEGFANELFRMQRSDNRRRQKRQAFPVFDGPASFMPVSPRFDFPYEDGREGRMPYGPQRQQPSFGPSFPAGAFNMPSEGYPRAFPNGPYRGMPHPPFRPPFGRPPMPFSRNPSFDFPFPPRRGASFSPFFSSSNDVPFTPQFGPRNGRPFGAFRGAPFPPPPQMPSPFGPSNDAPFPPPPSPGAFGRPFGPFPRAPFPPLPRHMPFGPSNDAPFPPPPGAFPPQFGPVPPRRGGPFPPPPSPFDEAFYPQGPPPFGPPPPPPLSPPFGFSMAPRFPMMWGPPISFPRPMPPPPPRPFGPSPQHQFLLDLFHGTTCASTGQKCLCCCGHYIPNVENGKCEDLHQLLPGIDRMVDKIAQGPEAPPPSFKDIRQMKKKFRKPSMPF